MFNGHPRQKLVEDAVVKIKQSDPKTTNSFLAEKFGVRPAQIYAIRLGKVWKHVRPDLTREPHELYRWHNGHTRKWKDKQMKTFEAVVLTVVGKLLVCGSSSGLTRIEWTDEDLSEEVDEDFKDWIEKVRSLNFDVPFVLSGTDFQKMVWNHLRSIPSGTTVSYSDVATAIGRPKAIRAVASACGKNKLAILIPCHRVVKNDGKISKYRWGVDRKRMLLDIEAS